MGDVAEGESRWLGRAAGLGLEFQSRFSNEQLGAAVLDEATNKQEGGK